MLCYQYSHNVYSILLLENTLDKQVKKFQLSSYHRYNGKQNSSLYSPTEMKSFVQTHSPSLWENLLSDITNYRAPLTTNRTDLQQKRMVALLHILAYFRYDTYFINDKQTFFLFFVHPFNKSNICRLPLMTSNSCF